MTQRDNILEELRELQSSLAHSPSQPPFTVPDGYFEGLADRVLNRVKALEAENGVEELIYLSPLLNSMSRTIPYTLPSGYFEGMEEMIRIAVANEGSVQSPDEELEMLSPLLSGLKKEMPYTVPDGYFENLNKKDTANVVPRAKLVAITHKWYRYAAAAILTGVILTAGFLFINNNTGIDPSEKSRAWVEKSVKKVSTDDIDKFVELADEAAPVIASADVTPAAKNEIKELIKDISDSEIHDFLEETLDVETGSEDELLN